MKKRTSRRRKAFSRDLATALNRQLRKMHLDQARVTEASIFQAGNVGKVVKVQSWAVLIDQSLTGVMTELSDETEIIVDVLGPDSVMSFTALPKLLKLCWHEALERKDFTIFSPSRYKKWS